jgi:hypothetical protein
MESSMLKETIFHKSVNWSPSYGHPIETTPSDPPPSDHASNIFFIRTEVGAAALSVIRLILFILVSRKRKAILGKLAFFSSLNLT